jgi:capsular polysaccharide transport system permease protein
MRIATEAPQSTWSLLQSQSRVIVAIMLRDIRTRFFGNGVGFLVAIGWPLTHILALLAIFSLFGRGAPYGESITLFFATGLVPFMAFMYMSRFTMLSLIMNKPLLVLPAIRVVDILVARALLEMLGSCCTIILLLIIFWFLGIDFVPPDIVEAAFALGAAMLLGIGFGMLNGVIAMAAPTWATGYALVLVLAYITSGIAFVPDAMPEKVRYYLSFIPTLQTVEWMRSAYYEGYSSILDKTYTVSFGVVVLFLGLAIERLVRGHLLINR